MRDKILTLLLVLLVAITTFASAQQSASSVMDVSVKVIKAGNVSATSSSMLTMDNAGRVSGKLGSVAIVSLKENRLLVETQNRLELINESGNKIDLTVGVSKKGTTERMNFEFKTERAAVHPNQNNGTYTGTITTKIEYL